MITTTTKTITTIDGCTTRTTVTEKNVDLAGTLTVDGVTRASNAFVQVFSLRETTTCR